MKFGHAGILASVNRVKAPFRFINFIKEVNFKNLRRPSVRFIPNGIDAIIFVAPTVDMPGNNFNGAIGNSAQAGHWSMFNSAL
jgi:hypothetical protein